VVFYFNFLGLRAQFHKYDDIITEIIDDGYYFISVTSGNSIDCKERAREIQEILISEYAIIFMNYGTKFGIA